MENKYKNSFDYIGAAISDKSLIVSKSAEHAFSNLKMEALRIENTPFNFSRGNIFEFIEGAKVEISNAKQGNIFKISPVNASYERQLYQSPEDISYVDFNGNFIKAQAKVSDDPNWLIDNLSQEKYLGQQRWCPSDMYNEVKNNLIGKLEDGTITPIEKDTLDNLVMTKTSNMELESLKGANDKIDLNKVDLYIEQQQNKLFMEECLNNTAAITLSSSIFGCAFSSVKNFYEYYKGNQNIETAMKNIGKDTLKSTGHGLVASTIGNCIKYVGYSTENMFLRNGINSLVIANGSIDLCKSVYYFKKGNISMDDLIHNIIGTSALTVANLGINYILPGATLIKLTASIIMHQILEGFLYKPNEKYLLSKTIDNEIVKAINLDITTLHNDLREGLLKSQYLYDTILDIFKTDNYDIDKPSLKSLCEELNMNDLYETYDNFIDDLDCGKTIEIKF